MFHCTFCGRESDVQYERSSAKPGLERFIRLFDEAGSADPHRFYISGGLEPLTNPFIGELVREGNDRGFRLAMYTNALMLTPALLVRQPGLWSLDVLRVSLYGVDTASATAITGHRKSFDQVISNIVEFLRLREENGSNVRIGLNHVLTSGNPAVVERLQELIVEIRRRSGTRRGIDFLTLREDYRVAGEQKLSGAHRETMRSALVDLVAQTQPGRALADTVVDLGYALHFLQSEWPTQGLRFVDESQLRTTMYPQVSVAVDSLGDVYGYREAAFPGRPGADRFIIGRLDDTTNMLDVVADWLRSGRSIEPRPGDLNMLDIFDHVVSLVLDGAARDAAIGLPADRGPIRAWRQSAGQPHAVSLSHPFPMPAQWANPPQPVLVS